jgi:acetolactate synthase I/II/III large subunit
VASVTAPSTTIQCRRRSASPSSTARQFSSSCATTGYASQTWNVYKYFAQGAAARSGEVFGNVITPTPDYVKLAEAYEGTGERVEKTAALESAIDRALAALARGRSALLDVFVTP